MAIDLSTELEARLKSRAEAEGISVDAYVARLLTDEESRSTRVAAFQAAIDERLALLDAGEAVDGEEVMTRLIAELDEVHGSR